MFPDPGRLRVTDTSKANCVLGKAAAVESLSSARLLTPLVMVRRHARASDRAGCVMSGDERAAPEPRKWGSSPRCAT